MNTTYAIAMAAGHDAGNRHMRAAGRSEWDESDWQAAAEQTARLMLPEPVTDATALRILGRMRPVDDFDYLADHGAEPITRDPSQLRVLLLADIACTGTDVFCDRMGWYDQ